ncbi:EAL domain-containing protein, partial [Methylobacterium sp. WL30]
TLGHPMGDALLKKVADRLRSTVRPTDTVARIGGDEFVILQTGIQEAANTQALARRLVDLIGRTYMVDGHLLTIGASVGVALAPGDGSDADTLLKNADLALYRAKLDGRATYRFFEPEMDARMQARRQLELDMRQALARREFQLHYQPQLQLEGNRLVGCEALIRWQHPVRGMVSPLDFIPLAEEIGLIVPIGEWVMRQACRDAVTWPAPLSVAVNVSPAQFKSERLVEMIMSALAASGLPATRLEVEITEGVLLQHS